MFFSDFYTLVSEQDGYLIQRHAGKKTLDSERVSKHVWVASLCGSVFMLYVGELEDSSQAALPITHGRFEQTVASPEEVPGVWFWARRNVS